MLRTRVITAIIAAAILVPTILFGGIIGVTILVAVLSGIATWEIARCFPGLKAFPGKELTLLLGLTLIGAFYALPQRAIPAVLVWFPLLVLVIHLILYNSLQNTIESVGPMIFVPAYAVIPLGHAVLLSRLELGIEWIFFVLVVICLGDAGAYFAGNYLGRHHFSEKVSPAKTIEGLLGGVAGNFAGMLGMELVVPSFPPTAVLAKLTLLLAIAGPLGDLCASALKRRFQIKDFGALLPGHGGVMDRADSLIFAFPVVYHFLVITGWAIPR